MDFSCMHFYKHMNGFFTHSISLPDKLTTQLAHLSGKLLELKRPSGGTWYVGLIKSGDKLILQPGWNDFASDNIISQNDHLVFKFVGESTFEVFIFESAGYEKGGILEKDEQEQDESLGSIVGEELPKVDKLGMNKKDEKPAIQHKLETNPLKRKKPSTDEEQGGLAATSDSIPFEEPNKILYQKRKLHNNKGEMKMQKPNFPTKLRSKKMQRPDVATKLLSKNSEANEKTSSHLLLAGEFHPVKSQKTKLRSEFQTEMETPMRRPRQQTSKFFSTAGQEVKSLQSRYWPRVPLTAEQMSRAQQLASKVQAKNPYFPIILKKYTLTSPHQLIIPNKFSADHLERKTLKFILDCPDQGKTWLVSTYFVLKNNQHVFGGPTLKKFVKENKLQPGDICVFELVKTAKQLTFVVQISRSTITLDS